MQVTETLSDGLKRAYTVVVPAADIETKRAARLANLGKTLNLPGFRPGKIPMDVLRKRYGTQSRQEAVNRIVAARTSGANGSGASFVPPGPVTEELISQHLYTADLPDPDLLIRTSGEMRVSNFLLWQIAYAEMFVTETLWPDFNRARLFEALLDFQKRERRYGAISAPQSAAR